MRSGKKPVYSSDIEIGTPFRFKYIPYFEYHGPIFKVVRRRSIGSITREVIVPCDERGKMPPNAVELGIVTKIVVPI